MATMLYGYVIYSEESGAGKVQAINLGEQGLCVCNTCGDEVQGGNFVVCCTICGSLVLIMLENMQVRLVVIREDEDGSN